jgi:enolase
MDPIADVAIVVNCKQANFGAPTSGERNTKYNRLLRIEEELGSSAGYAGREIFANN